MEDYGDIINLLPDSIKKQAARIISGISKLQEIRLRVNEYAAVICDNREYFLDENGSERIKESDVKECFKKVSEYSAYAYEEELRNGYITIRGGHRVGVAGKAIVSDGHIKNIRYVSFINIRVARQVKGCSDRIAKYILSEDKIHNTLIISPPGGGKTTLLRDIIRRISSGDGCIKGVNVGVVDERSEICACYRGVPQNDVGIRTDVLDACPKAEGIVRMIRSMSPAVIAADEIGTKEDMAAIGYAMVSGCGVIATIHGCGMEDISNNRLVNEAIKEKRFDRFIIMSGRSNAGNVLCVRDAEGRILYDGS